MLTPQKEIRCFVVCVTFGLNLQLQFHLFKDKHKGNTRIKSLNLVDADDFPPHNKQDFI